MPKNLLLFLILFLSLSSPYAAEKEPVYGVWQGTIGNKTVVVGFGGEKGHYFDTEYLKLITLAANNQDLYEWTEKVGEKTTAVWQLTNVDREHITGVWQNAENKQTYKITLTLTQSIPEAKWIDLNNLVQTYNKKFTYGKPTQFGEHQYRTIAFNNQVSNLELLDNAPNIKQLNNMLKFGLQAQISEHMDCASEAERQRGENATAGSNSSITIEFWNDDWIVFKLIKSGDCGGDSSVAAYNDTVNLKTLKITQLRNWFEDDLHLQLMDIVGKQAVNQRKAETVNQEDKHGCIDLYMYQTAYYQLSIGKKGLIFSTQFPDIIDACREDVEIPYATLIPYLNAEGKKHVDKLKASES